MIKRMFGGMDKNISPLDSGQGKYPYALNAVNQTFGGDKDFLSNEPGNIECPITEGYQVIGSATLTEGRAVVFSTNGESSEIGILSPGCKYEPVVNTPCLNFSPIHPVRATYRVRQGCGDTVYFTDNLNPVRVIQLNQISQYFTDGEFDCSKAELFRPFSQPCLEAEARGGGLLEVGSYHLAVRYLDSDLNPTRWFGDFGTVTIFEGQTVASIKGTFTETIDPINGTPPVNKSIEVSISSQDRRFPYIQIGVVLSTSATGEFSTVKVSPPIPSGASKYTISNIADWAEGNLEEIAIDPESYGTALSLEQVENRLLLANLKSKERDYCKYQKFANEIEEKFTSTPVGMFDVSDPLHPKNPLANDNLGYMGYEVYQRGIVYVYEDGSESPVFLIPGRTPTLEDKQLLTVVDGPPAQGQVSLTEVSHLGLSAGDTVEAWKVQDTSSPNGTMGYFEIDETYPEDLDCDGGFIWGELAGRKKRFNRMPSRATVPLVEGGSFNVLGVEFSNVQYPEDDIVAHYFVRARRTESEKTVTAAGYLADLNFGNAFFGTAFIQNFPNISDSNAAFLSPDIYYGGAGGGFFNISQYTRLDEDTRNSQIAVAVNGEDSLIPANLTLSFNILSVTESLGPIGSNVSIGETINVEPEEFELDGGVPYGNNSGSLPVTVYTLESEKAERLDTKALQYATLGRAIEPYRDFQNLQFCRISKCLHLEGETTRVLGGDTFISNLPLIDVFSGSSRDANSDPDNLLANGELFTALFCESSVNSSLAVSTNNDCGLKYNPVDIAGSNYQSYLSDYLTSNEESTLITIPKYTGFCPFVFTQNPDFSITQRSLKQRSVLVYNFDCCSKCVGKFPNRIAFSRQSFAEEQVDNFRVFLPLNYADLEAERGEITALARQGNNIIYFTEEAAWSVPQNIQERVSQDGIVSYLGTGGLFAIPPRLLLDTATGEGGCIDQFSTLKTKAGLIWVDRPESAIYMLGQGVKEISEPLTSFLEEHMGTYLRDAVEGLPQSSLLMEGVQCVYDNRFDRVIVSYRDYEPLRPVKSKAEERGVLLYEDGKFFVFDRQFIEVSLDDPRYFCDKSFTLSYSLDTQQWVSFHSYLPTWMLSTKEAFYSFKGGLWSHNAKGVFNSFYGQGYSFIAEWVFPSPLKDLSTEHVQLTLEAKKDGAHEKWGFFDRMVVYNNYQSTGLLNIVTRNEQGGKNLLSNRIRNRQGELQADRVGQNWYLNFFRTFVQDYSERIVDNSCPDFKESDKGFINTSPSEDWKGRFVMEGKYLFCRMILDKTDTQLVLHYALHNAIENEE